MSSENRELKTVMHPTKMRELRVKNIQSLSPTLKRITFTGEELKDFVSLSPDDHVKIFFPYPGEEKAVLPTFTKDGPVVEGDRKPLMRDYTPRRYDNNLLELDIDFVLHGEGVGSQWADSAQIGKTLNIAGPRGSRIVPYAFDWYLMIGDECAIPSFARRITELPENAKGLIFIEVASEEQIVELPQHSHFEVKWVLRKDLPAGSTQPLKEALMKTAFPTGDFFSWVSCEKACAMDLKDFLITVRGAEDSWVKATGYWSL